MLVSSPVESLSYDNNTTETRQGNKRKNTYYKMSTHAPGKNSCELFISPELFWQALRAAKNSSWEDSFSCVSKLRVAQLLGNLPQVKEIFQRGGKFPLAVANSYSSNCLPALGQGMLGQSPSLRGIKTLPIPNKVTDLNWNGEVLSQEVFVVGKAAVCESGECKRGSVRLYLIAGMPVHEGEATLGMTYHTRYVDLKIKGQHERQQAFIWDPEK